MTEKALNKVLKILDMFGMEELERVRQILQKMAELSMQITTRRRAAEALEKLKDGGE